LSRFGNGSRVDAVTLLKRLRKYGRTLTGALLPVLAFVWVGAAASPCAAMHVALSGASSGDGAPVLPAAAGREMAPSGDAMSMSGSMPTMGHARVPAMDRGAMPSMEHGGGHASTHPQRPCPHCPPTQGHTAPHAACATLSAFLSSNDAPAAPAYDLLHALAVIGFLGLQEDPPRDERRRRWERPPDPSSHVPLNLRYCVFLN
jgi:hypothetical protein